MLSGTIRHGAGGIPPCRGFSFLELMASIVMIAAIAALALPTFQEFKPHGDFPEEIADRLPASDGDAIGTPPESRKKAAQAAAASESDADRAFEEPARSQAERAGSGHGGENP